MGRFRLGDEYQGGSGFLHGGIIALLLDEAMSKACRFHSEHAVTADLRVEYKRPIPANAEIVVEGFVTRRDGRQLYHEGEIRNEAGDLLARGEGRFVIIDREKYQEAVTRLLSFERARTLGFELRITLASLAPRGMTKVSLCFAEAVRGLWLGKN